MDFPWSCFCLKSLQCANTWNVGIFGRAFPHLPSHIICPWPSPTLPGEVCLFLTPFVPTSLHPTSPKISPCLHLARLLRTPEQTVCSRPALSYLPSFATLSPLFSQVTPTASHGSASQLVLPQPAGESTPRALIKHYPAAFDLFVPILRHLLHRFLQTRCTSPSPPAWPT